MPTISEVLDEKGHEVIGVAPTATVYEAIGEMVEHNTGSLLVMAGSHIEGIFTERDYLRKIALQGRTSQETAVREVMTSPVVVCVGTTEVEHRERGVACWVIVPTVVDTSKPDKKPRFTKTKIYLSADPSRAVLKVKTKAGIGTVRAKLKGFEPHPQTPSD